MTEDKSDYHSFLSAPSNGAGPEQDTLPQFLEDIVILPAQDFFIFKMTSKRKTILLSILILGIITPLLALGMSFLVARTVSKQSVEPKLAPEIFEPEAAAVSTEEGQSRNSPKQDTARPKTSTAVSQRPENTRVDPENSINVTVIAGNATAALAIPADTVFYDALVKARNEGKIDFQGKNYPGLGFFVTDIGTLHSGNGLDLLYYINGTEATVGVSSYTLKDGDIIEWKLE